MVKKSIIGKILNTTQLVIDKMYDKYGLTNNVLDLQIKTNTIRAKHNIPESEKKLNEQGFLQ